MPAILRHRFLDLRLRHTFRIARDASDARRTVVAELEHDGLVGLGEAAPIPRYGQTPESAARALETMAARLGDPRAFAGAAARAAVPGERAAEAALDMALHDLAGKRLGAPLYELLGLDPRAATPTSFTIGLDTPEAMARKTREAGDYEVLKIKLGTADDRALIEAVRGETDRPLRVDANEGWTLEQARERLAWESSWWNSRCRRRSSPRPASCGAKAPCPSSPTRACRRPRTSRAWPGPSTASTSSS
jgi:L-alanine-DL-glutamate epimerase-like enolase superfamily enzyme